MTNSEVDYDYFLCLASSVGIEVSKPRTKFIDSNAVKKVIQEYFKGSTKPPEEIVEENNWWVESDPNVMWKTVAEELDQEPEAFWETLSKKPKLSGKVIGKLRQKGLNFPPKLVEDLIYYYAGFKGIPL
jgi:Asp-tRNA(Asn)/Glu-tRNA(Gln) amidotransferase B subunit